MGDTTGSRPAEDGSSHGGGLDGLRDEIDEVGRRAARTVDVGRRGFTIAVGVFALVVGHVLPWAAGYAGWQVLVGDGGGAIPRLFAATSAAFGVLAPVLALATRRWWLSWVCALGGWFASVDGVLAVWSQQSSPAPGTPGAGPGAGMVVALIAMVLLAANWFRIAWSRG